MKEPQTLAEAYKQSRYMVIGHGVREVGILKEALENVDGNLNADLYGNGTIINDFEQKMADYLGKEAAVFFPSGTMAQQIALRIWCDGKGIKKVAYHPLCHLEIHEEDGLKELHHIEPILLAEKDRLIQLEDVLAINQEVSCLLLELPQREIGGQLPHYETIVEISKFCREKGIKLHLDGARLYETLPFYQKSAAEICSLFDSVYLSFYKGIGGIAGAILAGERDFIDQSKVWKRRHGGDLISLYPYILTADYYFDQRISKMDQYYKNAKELADYYNQCHPLIKTVPLKPVTNMFHVHFGIPKETLEEILIEVYKESGVGLISGLKEIDTESCYGEISLGDKYETVPQESIKAAFALIKTKLEAVN
ncbi:threonine aldolase family protein [Pseudoneobacillus sp. C159]